MTNIKQYSIFAKTNYKITEKMQEIIEGFIYTNWNVKINSNGSIFTGFILNKKDTIITLNGYNIANHQLPYMKWDICFISKEIKKEEIEKYIMPLCMYDTPEIYFF